ncbi:MAG TPA: hypothetical protein VK694_06250 [Verrucomicrobiae bacterium]|nr:hypothetical protein [Verrucomicrobiae bacterium]
MKFKINQKSRPSFSDIKERFKGGFTKRIAAALAAGFLLGVVWLVMARFIAYKPVNTHYHANFALYINGQRDEFKNFTFYEEVQSCGSDEKNEPKHRTHMHDNVNHVVHVHEPAVMWGHFFANLGYTLGDTVVKTDKGLYVDGQDGAQLTFTLNGKEVNNIANRLIKSEDVLLINYGKDSPAVLQQRYDGISKDAGEFNKRNDPSSCTGTKPLSFKDRLKKALSLSGQ